MIKYSAMFLKPDNPLMAIGLPAGWTRYAHHCTLEYRPENGRFPTGSGLLQVTEIRKTDAVIFAVVTPPLAIRQWAEQRGLTVPWHITIGTAPGVEPVVARHMTEQGRGEVIRMFQPPLEIEYIAGGLNEKTGTVVSG